MRYLVLLFIGLWGISVSAQAQKWESQQVFDYSQKVAEATRNQIWNEFEPMKYVSLKSEKDANFIVFSSLSTNPNNSFSWTLTDEYFAANSLENNLVITFHEAFHAFEADEKRAGKPWKRENALLIFEYQESSARNNALFNIESKILFEALQTKNTNQLKQKVRQFLAIRKLRQSELQKEFIEFEKGAESNEGMAEYAGLKTIVEAIKATKLRKISLPLTEFDNFLIKQFNPLNDINKIGKNIRRKFYFTGSAQGFLLDRLQKDWKTEVQMEGETVQYLLEKIAGKTVSKLQIEVILAKYNYPKILVEEAKAVTQRDAENQILLKKTLNQEGRKYTINYSALTGWTGIQNFDPMNVTMISPKVRVHTRSVIFGNENKFTAEFSQPVVEDLEKKEYTTFISQNESILIDGAEVDSSKSGELKFEKSLTINSANFKLGANRGVVKITNDGVFIKILEK